MRLNKLLILVSLFTFFLVGQASAQVEDTVLKSTDTLKNRVVKPIGTATPPKVMTRQDSMKTRYVNPGKVAGRKAVIKSLILPGLGQVYNMQLLNDGYGTRAGKSQTFQRIYTIGKIGAIYGGFTVLTMSYIESSKNYTAFLEELQYRNANNDQPPPNSPYARYSTQGVTTAKDTYRRNKQIVLFSYGLVYFANVVDAYVAARLHFFNIDDKLSFKVVPTMINSNSMYSFNAAPAVKLSLTF
ncbi:hypothetical protein DU508_18460 [Pedobacter chinensis]|uniref:DUF5683 domain-containing protein n=1 Tax=Pedobacter chinensis TaxID=2282421 RepID=A0A369PRG8_9SPHI|nr:DUF5683 domain-containing protein [Pedobacter chinensis]RDC55134.1 hypothetical protein DU508_18460 [Pedobacter chinensis]